MKLTLLAPGCFAQRQPPGQRHEHAKRNPRESIRLGISSRIRSCQQQRTQQDSADKSPEMREHVRLRTQAEQSKEQGACHQTSQSVFQFFRHALPVGNCLCGQESDTAHHHSRCPKAPMLGVNQPSHQISTRSGKVGGQQSNASSKTYQ